MQPIYLYRNSDEAELGKVRVDHFPAFPRPLHTIALHTHNFWGKVTVEASIALDPQSDDEWVVVWEEEFDRRDANMPAIRNRAKSLVGYFIWMRVTVEATTGHVDRVLVL